MICFMCKNSFDSCEDLVNHLKKKHELKYYSEVRCAELSCSQCFRNMSSFKKHLQKHQHNLSYLSQKEKKKNQVSPSNNYNFSIPSSAKKHKLNISLDMQENDNCENETMQTENQSQSRQVPRSNLTATFIQSAFNFTLSLYDISNMPRSDVIFIQKNVNDLIINPLLNVFKDFGATHLTNNLEALNEISDIIANCRSGLREFKSEYKIEQKLKSSNLMEDLIEVVINNSIQPLHKMGALTYSANSNKCYIMPLNYYFKKIFENQNCLQRTLENIDALKSSVKCNNFVNGELWKKKESMYPNKICIPYFLYFDDLEINNPLGCHTKVHSICNAYISFPCYPKKESNIENVFLAAIFKSTDVKVFGNEKCFRTLVDILTDLELNGVSIISNDQEYQVHFLLGLIIGDNLGLNCVLNFSRSFSSNFYCRLCKVKKEDGQMLCIEMKELLRTRENYRDDIKTDDSKSTGVTENCIFNEIPSFHAVENYYCDVMHDVFEGVCHYDFAHILIYFLQSRKYFDLDTLNSRKKYFHYGNDIGNISGDITLPHLKKRRFKMSASEMQTFAIYFPLMVGDLVPHNDEVWQFLLILIEIIDIVSSFEMSEFMLSTLSAKIKLHNEEYIRLFKDSLKPKFHNLTHYPNIVRMAGPLRLMWCFKYEAKHRQFKVYSHNITSRKNICLSLSKKYQFKFAYQLQKNINYNDVFFDETNITKSVYFNFIKTKLGGDDIKFFKELKYCG